MDSIDKEATSGTPWRLSAIIDKAWVVVPQLIPLIGVLALGWSAGSFLVLGLFQLSFSITAIGLVGVNVSRRQKDPDIENPDWTEKVAGWLKMTAAAGFCTLMIMTLVSWPVFIIVDDVEDSVFDPALLASAAAIMLTALPGLIGQYRADLAANLDDETRKARDRPRVGMMFMSCGVYFLLAGFAGSFGRLGLCLLAVLVTGLSILRDWKPELASTLFPVAGKSPAEPSNPKANRNSKNSRR